MVGVVREAREALLYCTQHIALFVPNGLLGKLHLVFLDTVAFDDANPARRVRQSMLEEQLQHMVLLLHRDLESLEPVLTHLRCSPFTQRLVSAHRSPTTQAGPKPKLSAVVFM